MKFDRDQNFLAQLIAKRLIQRRDVKAKQLDDGAYNPVTSQFTVRDLSLHMAGQVTLGHYLVDQAGLCRVVAFDLDFDKEFEWQGQELSPREIFGTDHPARPALNAEIRQLADGLAFALKRRHPTLTVLTTFSGSKGIHVYGCFPEPTTAAVARKTAISLLDWFGCFELVQGKNFYKHTMGVSPAVTIETYPKQVGVGVGGYGNLLRLPLGVNRKTGHRSFFYNPRTDPTVLEACDSVAALQYGTVRTA